MSRKLDVASCLVLLGAALLLVSLFLEWFSPDLSAWGAFESLDLVLAALAIGAAAVASGRLDGQAPGLARWLAPVAVAAFLIVAVQLVDPPPAAGDADRELGAWMALLGTLLMVAGAVLTLARVSVVLDVQGREEPRRTAAVGREDPPTAATAAARAVPSRPAPPRAGGPRDPAPRDPDRTEPMEPPGAESRREDPPARR